MAAVAIIMAKYRYASQIIAVAILVALATYGAVSLNVPPSGWNVLWFFGPTVVAGLTLNRGLAAIAMTVALLCVSWIAASSVGTAMGGI